MRTNQPRENKLYLCPRAEASSPFFHHLVTGFTNSWYMGDSSFVAELLHDFVYRIVSSSKDFRDRKGGNEDDSSKQGESKLTH